MATTCKLKGLDKAIKALRGRGKTDAVAFERNMKRAGLFLQRESQRVVPIDTSNLKNSAFTRQVGAGWAIDVIVGYTAMYAVYVHENLEARHAPGKQAKFLEGPLRVHRQRIIRIIRGEL